MCKLALQGYDGGSSILIIQPPTNPSSIFVSSTPVLLVFVGFGHTHTQENVAKMSYVPERGEEMLEVFEDDWSGMVEWLCFRQVLLPHAVFWIFL